MYPLDNPAWQSLQTRHRGFAPAVDAGYARLGYPQRIDISLWSLKRLTNDGDPP